VRVLLAGNSWLLVDPLSLLSPSCREHGGHVVATLEMVHLAIDAIVGFARQQFGAQPTFSTGLPLATDAQRLGNILWEEAVRSAQCIDGRSPSALYVWMQLGETVALVEFLRLLDWLEYQSNASPDYYERPAFLAIDAMRRRAIRLLPGYELEATAIRGRARKCGIH